MNTADTVPQGIPGFIPEPTDKTETVFKVTANESVCAVLSYVLAFAYTGIFINSQFSRSAYLAVTAILIVAVTELINKNVSRSAESWIWLACFACAVFSGIRENGSVWDHDQILLFIHIFAVWWIISRGDVLLEGKSGHLLPLDALNGFLLIPFSHFFLRIRTLFCSLSRLFSHRERRKDGRLLWTVAAFMIGAFLFFKATSLLLSADSGFHDRFLIVSDFVERILDMIAECIDEIAFVRLVLSIPIGCWLFGLISGTARTDRDTLERERSAAMSFLERIRKVPANAWAFVIGAFSMMYLAFFVLQSSYLFGAFTGTLPDGFIVSQYAREGFFELCRVISVNFTLLWFVTRMTSVETKRSPLFLVPCIVLLAESLIFSAIAFSKLYLYIHCFGFTPLRLQSTWLVCLCFAGCVLWIFSLLTGKSCFRKWMIFGAISLSALCLI